MTDSMDGLKDLGEGLKDIGVGIGDMFVDAADSLGRSVLNLNGMSSAGFTVNKENVLAAAKIIDDEATRLDDLLDRASSRLFVEAPADDEISSRMADGWNDLLLNNSDSYANRVGEYIVGLQGLVAQLQASATQYGYTDEEIAAALGKTGA